MSRFGTVGQQYFDSSGDPLSGGLLYFYEPGTTTDKTTYSDNALSVANAQPYVLDSGGYQGDIFFAGEAKVVLRTSAGVEVDTADPVGEADTDSGIKDWSSSATYDLNDVVKASDGIHYQSVQNSNTNHDPAGGATPSWWMALEWLTVWNTNYTYATDQLVTYDDQVWRSTQGSNAGNTPAYNSAYWETLSRDLNTDYTVKTSGFNAAAGGVYLTNTAGGTFNATLSASPTVGDRVGFVDVSGSWDATNYLRLNRNGNKIMNLLDNMDCDKANAAVYLEYTGATYGWVII